MRVEINKVKALFVGAVEDVSRQLYDLYEQMAEAMDLENLIEEIFNNKTVKARAFEQIRL